MSRKVSEHVDWVGKVDWQLKTFHGDELSTEDGSSYNSYLIRDDKTVLIDTVWLPYDREFVERLKRDVDLKKIDAIVMNHNEVDHSGALPALMAEIPDTPIYCTKNGEKIIRGMYHQDWNFVNVKTGDTLDLGQGKLTFVEAPFLHWPDTMFTYYNRDEILFSNDGFGEHFATESLFDDENDLSEILHEALKYYANILAPFNRMVQRKVNEVVKMNLPLKLVAPSHGVIWRSHIQEIINAYLKWSDAYAEQEVVLLYDTMWNSTRVMAENIARGIKEYDDSITVKLMNTAKTDKSDVMLEAFRAKGILVGSPTYDNGYLYSVAGTLEQIRGAKLMNKAGSAFGSYGWSGEAVKKMNEKLAEAGVKVVDDGLRLLWVPDASMQDMCAEYGRKFASEVFGGE